MSNTMRFRTTANDFRNEPKFQMIVEAETGKPSKVTLNDAETMEGVVVFLLPAGAASNLSAAFGLIASMEQEQLKDDLMGGRS